MTKDELKRTLEKLPAGALTVEVEGERAPWVAYVISPDFDLEDVGPIQERVWGLLMDEYGFGVAQDVEFVFAMTPAEIEAGKAAS